MSAPAGASLEQLRPRGAEHEQLDVGGPGEQVFDEVEQRVVGPVKVLEHEHRRSARGEPLDEAPPRREGLCPAIAEQRVARLQSHERAQMTKDPAGLVRILDHACHGRGEQRRGGLRLVRLQHPGLGLHDLPKAQNVPPDP